MSFNLRYENKNDVNEFSWDNRKANVFYTLFSALALSENTSLALLEFKKQLNHKGFT